MKGLKCTTGNCEYNHACHCSAGIVNINVKGACKTRIKRKYGVMEQEFSNMEAAEEFDYSENEDVMIECDSVHCDYNKSKRCGADIVAVGDGVVSAKCKTKSLGK